MPRVGTKERLSLYASTIAFQWFAVVVVGWRAWARGVSSEELGLTLIGGLNAPLVSVAGVAVFASLHLLNLRRLSKFSAAARGPLQRLAECILPYLLLAITAGICEEFLYRGFVMAVLARAGLSTWSVILLSSILFGLAHLYHGRSGFVSTLLVGAVFATARIAYHSLVPVILWHVTVDIVAGTAGSRYLLAGTDKVPEP